MSWALYTMLGWIIGDLFSPRFRITFWPCLIRTQPSLIYRVEIHWYLIISMMVTCLALIDYNQRNNSRLKLYVNITQILILNLAVIFQMWFNNMIDGFLTKDYQ